MAKSPPASASARAFSARAGLLDLLRARLVRQPHQNMGQFVFHVLPVCRLVLLQVAVDLAVAHLDLVVDLALAQLRQQDLVAHLVAELVEVHAVALERGTELRQREVVALGDALDGGVELRVPDLEPALLRQLQLRLLEDQPLQDLALEHLAIRQRRALAPQLALHERDVLVELALRHHVLVDDRHDAVDRDELLGRRRRGGKQEGE